MTANKKTGKKIAGLSRKSTGIGAAAFAVGLYLAAPTPAAIADDAGADGASVTPNASGAGSPRTTTPTSRRGRSAATAARTAAASQPAAQESRRAPEGAARTARPAGAARRAPARPAPAVTTVSTGPATAGRARAAMSRAERLIPAAATGGACWRNGVCTSTTPTVTAQAPSDQTAAPTLPDFGALRATRIANAEDRFFNTAANWLAALPASDLTANLQGALLLVRKRLFATGPSITPTRQQTSQDGTIYGSVNAISPQGDPLTYNLVSEPRFGTVDLAADGSYTYTPGSGYSGVDRFTVTVAPAAREVNILLPGRDNSRQVTIQIGAPSVTGPVGVSNAETDARDAAVYLPLASGNIAVKKAPGNTFAATVTLTGLTPDAKVLWQDSAGHLGSVSVAELASTYWPEFQSKAELNGGGVNVMIAYTGADGTDYAALLRKVKVRQTAGGDYVFTGNLSPNSADNPDTVDTWDVVGHEYKPAYDSFLSANGIGTTMFAKFNPVSVDFTQGAFFAATYTPLSFAQDGLYALDSEKNPQAANLGGPGASPVTPSADATAMAVAAAGVTAVIPLGGSYVIGRNDGSVELWTEGQRKVLQGNGWGQPVTSIIDYSRPLKDFQGNTIASSFTGYIDGTTLTVTELGVGSSVVVGQQITGAGIAPGTTITGFIPRSADIPKDCTDTSCSGVSGGQGGSNGQLGTYSVSIAQTVGSSLPAGDGQAAGITITQPSVPAIAPGFIVGLGNGAVEIWSADSGFSELHDSGWGSAVNSIAAYGDGVVVGLANGSVQRWVGPSKPASSFGDTLSFGGATTLRAASNQSIVSANGSYQLKLQQDGNLVLYGGGSPVWASGTDNQGVDRAVLQADGNFVLYAGNTAKWSTWSNGGTNGASGQSEALTRALVAQAGPGSLRMVVQDDRNVVLYSGDTALWSTRTNTTNPAPSPWAANWTELQGTGWGLPVSGIVGHKDGLVVALGGAYGAVEYWDPAKGGWTELQGRGWSSGVTAMSAYGDGVAVGLRNGSVQYWNGTTSFHSGWTQLQGPGWGQQVSTIIPWQLPGCDCSALIVGLGAKPSPPLPGQPPRPRDPGGVMEFVPTTNYDPSSGSWRELQGNGWLQPVTTMFTYRSQGVANGVVVGLDNGSVQLWNGDPAFNPKVGFTELHDSGWASGVRGMVPIREYVADSQGNLVARDSVVVGLNNGSVQQWSGVISGPTGQGDWKEIYGPEYNTAASELTSDVLKSAVSFVKTISGTKGDFGDANSVGGSGDPLFSKWIFQSAAAARGIDGIYYPIASYIPKSPVSKTFAADGKVDVSVDLGLDTNIAAYGYAFVPDGVFAKLVPGKYSLAMLAALEAGPSVTVNLGQGGTINVPNQNLFNWQFTTPGPLLIDTFAVDIGANAALSATLIGAPESDKLHAHAYAVPGLLLTWNTNSNPKGIELGYNWYPDVNIDDFKNLTGISITPTITPYVTASYGVFVPKSYWIIGGWSLFALSLGYENPVSATFCADAASTCPGGKTTSLSLTSTGYVTAHAGLLEAITSSLSWDGKYKVYEVSNQLV